MRTKLRQKIIETLIQKSQKLYFLVERLYFMICNRYYQQISLESQLKLRYIEDYNRYVENSWIGACCIFPGSSFSCPNPEALSAIITMEYHRLEKGLSLPGRRDGSSQDVVRRLIEAISSQLDQYGHSQEGYIGISVLEVYFKETNTELLSSETISLFKKYLLIKNGYCRFPGRCAMGGYKKVNISDISYDRLSSQNFIQSRHSVRDYEQRTVALSEIEKACSIAMSAPSVCNRQAWKLYAYRDRGTIKTILKFQNGNRGFTDQIPLLFIICADIRRFVSVDERNQPLIDGGIFSMNLMLALHSQGIGSCPLNWCSNRENDTSLRKFLGIPNSDLIIMLLSAGYYLNDFTVTNSPRRNVKSILVVDEFAKTPLSSNHA